MAAPLRSIRSAMWARRSIPSNISPRGAREGILQETMVPNSRERDRILMSADQTPMWATRLREERRTRLWSQKTMAARLRDAADPKTRLELPGQISIQRYVRGYEAGEHHPGDFY